MGIGLCLGAFWVLAGGAIFGGLVAVINGAGLAGALCACVWRVLGAWAGQQMLCGSGASGMLGGAWGLWRGWLWGWRHQGSSGVALPVGIPGVSGSDLGCCGWLGVGRAVGWAGRWVVAGGFLSILLYFLYFIIF